MSGRTIRVRLTVFVAVVFALTMGEAVQTYSILTIGDGLVSQIPALLVSTAAGLIAIWGICR